MNVVSMRNVSYQLQGVSILEDINLDINSNDFLALIGPNGGGKSTLLRIILGLISPQKGIIKVFNRDPSKSRNLIGYLPQYTHYDPDFPINVYETVLMGRSSKLWPKIDDEDYDAVDSALKSVGMFKYRDRQISRLSGGQKQRVFIARALVRQPKLLLLDEPMASIDPEMQQSFYTLISKLKKKMAIVLVSHDVGAVSDKVNKIACLNRKLFYHGPVEGSADSLEKIYHCPIDLISHGIPHRVLRKH